MQKRFDNNCILIVDMEPRSLHNPGSLMSIIGIIVKFSRESKRLLVDKVALART